MSGELSGFSDYPTKLIGLQTGWQPGYMTTRPHPPQISYERLLLEVSYLCEDEFELFPELSYGGDIHALRG